MARGMIEARGNHEIVDVEIHLAKLPAGELYRLNVSIPAARLLVGKPGIF